LLIGAVGGDGKRLPGGEYAGGDGLRGGWGVVFAGSLQGRGAIADAVGRIFDDAELRWRLYRGGLKLAHSRTWENEQEQFLSIIYKECGKQH